MSLVNRLKTRLFDAYDRALYGILPEPSVQELAKVSKSFGKRYSAIEVRRWTRLALACASGRQDLIRVFDEQAPEELVMAITALAGYEGVC